MCGCEHHWEPNAACNCKCSEHEGVRREMKDREERMRKLFGPSMAWVRPPAFAATPAEDRHREGRHRKPLTDDDMENDCTHQSATGVDTAPMGPMKVWRCDHCGLQWTEGAEVLVDGTWFPWNDLPRILESFSESERKAWADAKRMAIRLETVRAEHRREWADYITEWVGAVGPTPPTVESIIAALLRPDPPFGCASVAGEPNA